MRISWAPSARREFNEAIAYMAARSPTGARRVGAAILAAIDLLEDFPDLAPPSRHRGLRQMFVVRTPYLVVYRVMDDRVEIRAIIHVRRRRRR
jgi:toxin ParE1/3/4